jgi:hypothetical protein
MKGADRTATRERRRRRGLPLIVIVGLVAIAYIALNLTRAGRERRIADLASIAAKLSAETVPLRFMVLSRTEGRIGLRIRLYDLSGKEIEKFETSLSGNELFFDFLLSPLGKDGAGGGSESSEGRWLAFPFRIFTDTMPAAEGELLFDRYDRSGFPGIFDGRSKDLPALSAAEKLSLAALFGRIRKEAVPDGSASTGRRDGFGSAVHELSAISSFEKGLVYRIVCRAKGGIEIMEDER